LTVLPPLAGVLLDTCAVIWLANGQSMAQGALEAIKQAAMSDRAFVSPVSAWEIGVLSRRSAARSAMEFLPDPKTWFARFMAEPGEECLTVVAIQQIGAHQLDRDGPADIRVVRLIDYAHGAAADFPLHPVAADMRRKRRRRGDGSMIQHLHGVGQAATHAVERLGERTDLIAAGFRELRRAGVAEADLTGDGRHLADRADDHEVQHEVQ